MGYRSTNGYGWLLALLAFGVMVMHHAPLAHASDSAPMPMPPALVQLHGTHAAQAADVPHAQVGRSAEPAAHSSPDRQPAHEHGWLHLCLAILAAAIVLFAAHALRASALLPKAPFRAAALGPGRSRSRPPPPLPRRLAQLCVLRL